MSFAKLTIWRHGGGSPYATHKIWALLDQWFWRYWRLFLTFLTILKICHIFHVIFYSTCIFVILSFMSHIIDMNDLNSFPKFVAPKPKVKVKATGKVKNTFLAITSVLLKLETWNQRHFVPLLKAFQKYAILFDVTLKEVRQNDVIRWRHFQKFVYYKTDHMMSWGMVPICHI